MPIVLSKRLSVVMGLVCYCGVVQARFTIAPVSYDMPNGDSSTHYRYWDDRYDGHGANTGDNMPLTGGTGDLTDGIVASGSFLNVEGQSGPYVGWEGHWFNNNLNPLITFHFDQAYAWKELRIHLDDEDGVGDVEEPSKVIVNGHRFDVADPGDPGPFWARFNLDGKGLMTKTLDVQLIRSDTWVFASEFEFIGECIDGEPVPVPIPGALLLGSLGSGFVGFVRRRRLV